MKSEIRTAALLLLPVIAMCTSANQAAAQSGTQQQLARANTEFGFRLLKELAGEQAQANLFISPYSISSVLQLLSAGADGVTRQELQQVLGTTNLSPASLNAAYEELDRSLRTQTNVTLNIANALWYRAGVQLAPQFVALNEQYYKATLKALDFAAPDSAKVMNEWASQSTHGRIQTIIQPPISPNTSIVLANAIYFKGTWLDPFDPRQTKQRAFHLLNGSQEQLPMMQLTRSFQYQEGTGFQAIQLSYVGNELVMQILLPKSGSSVPALLAQMNADFWQNVLIPGFRQNRGTLVLPRFKLRYGADLKTPLSALGTKSALSPDADFSAMSSSRLFLSDIKHQSFVEVNEEGTEAAAVTTGVMTLAALRNQPPPFQMVVDRPFLFAISDQKTKSILFAGAVFDPGQAGE